MINKIKNNIKTMQGKHIKVLVDIGRNKSEEYIGIVDKTYDNVWTLKTEKGIKSFSYKDILIKTIILKPF